MYAMRDQLTVIMGQGEPDVVETAHGRCMSGNGGEHRNLIGEHRFAVP